MLFGFMAVHKQDLIKCEFESLGNFRAFLAKRKIGTVTRVFVKQRRNK